MKIAVLNSSYEHSGSDFRGHDPAADPSRFLADHEVEVHPIDKATAVAQVRALVSRGFDVFVNLCDGAWDEDRAGIEVVQTLERLQAAFTGAGSNFYDPSRRSMKLACSYAGIDTPAFVFATGRADAERAAAGLRFPLIVKHPESYSSIGMTPASRVESAEELFVQVERVAGAYGAALIEEFVEGREFTVLVAEPGLGEARPRAYLPLEVEFPPGESFKHFTLKWIDYERIGWKPVEEPELAERLQDASRALFTALGGSGYGRCDLRMGEDGRLAMLEINPNCAVFYPEGQFGSADLILARDPAGHRGFLEHAIACARRRREAALPRAEVRFDVKTGWGLYAVRDLAAGELVEAWEERAHHLVSRAHAEKSWDALHRRWLKQYAWPLSDGLYVMWSSRPEDWRPLNHSCDPNTWLCGLDLVARRPLKAGEAVSIDYATFCGPETEEFDCACGSPLCRGRVRGSDHLQPFVAERYGGHVSDYVRRARASAR